MKSLLIIQDTLENKITYYHLALFTISLPFDRFYSEIILISLLLHTCIHTTQSRLKKIVTIENILLSSLFLLAVIGISWSQDKKEAFGALERQLSILLFPIILSITGIDINRNKEKWLIIMSCTCVLTVIYLYIDAVQIILYYKLTATQILSPSFINHNFSAPIGIHATYLSMYISLSIAVFISLLLKEQKTTNRLLQVGALLILLAGLIQLASRAVMAATVIFIVLFPFFLAGIRKKILFLAVSIGIVLTIGITIFNSNTLKKRYIAALQQDLTQNSITNEITEPRVVRWQSAIQLVKQSPVFGHGSGSEKRLLKEKYFESRLFNSYLQELDAHNQYLSLLLKYGIIGLLLFLFLLFRGFSASFNSRDIIFCAFLVLISITSLSENILDVNKGIFFFAFFFSLFMKSSKPFAGIFRFLSRKSSD